MSAFRFRHRLQVRFRDCDLMGHVNTAVYFTYVEQARFAYWQELSGADAGAPPPSIIVARAECDFVRSAMPGEWLDVWLGTTRIGRTSFTIDCEILGQDGQLVARATTVQVMYDYALAKAVPVPDAFRARMEEYEGRKLSQPS
jgi:acyl-CoA thioester hydrolase